MPLFCIKSKNNCLNPENIKQNCPEEFLSLPCCPHFPCPQETNISCPSCCEEKKSCPLKCHPQQENLQLCKSQQVNRSLCPEKSTCPKKTDTTCRGTAKYRNAYLNFLEEYRRNHKHLLPWQVTTRAACCWKNLSEEEKCKYKIDAQNAKYIYRSKNRTLNKILKGLKEAIKCPTEVDVNKLAAVACHLDKWKEDVLEDVDFC